MHTRGVRKDAIPAPEKLNKARAARGLGPIREHTVIRIGHVYDREGRAHAYSEGSRSPMRVHWRRAHTRRQHYGARREHVKTVLIQACLVNYEGGDVPEFKAKVTR